MKRELWSLCSPENSFRFETSSSDRDNRRELRSFDKLRLEMKDIEVVATESIDGFNFSKRRLGLIDYWNRNVLSWLVASASEVLDITWRCPEICAVGAERLRWRESVRLRPPKSDFLVLEGLSSVLSEDMIFSFVTVVPQSTSCLTDWSGPVGTIDVNLMAADVIPSSIVGSLPHLDALGTVRCHILFFTLVMYPCPLLSILTHDGLGILHNAIFSLLVILNPDMHDQLRNRRLRYWKAQIGLP